MRDVCREREVRQVLNNPTPIGTNEGSVIIVHKTSLAKIITTNDRGKYKFEINFKVSEKRPHQDNNIN